MGERGVAMSEDTQKQVASEEVTLLRQMLAEAKAAREAAEQARDAVVGHYNLIRRILFYSFVFTMLSFVVGLFWSALE